MGKKAESMQGTGAAKNETDLQEPLFASISDAFSKHVSLRGSLQETVGLLREFGDFAGAEIWLVNEDARRINRSVISVRDEQGQKFFDASGDVISLRSGEGMAALTPEAQQMFSATYENPDRPTTGIETVLVNGVPVVHEARPLDNDPPPGRALRAELKAAATGTGYL
jgi:hypothetical protein